MTSILSLKFELFCALRIYDKKVSKVKLNLHLCCSWVLWVIWGKPGCLGRLWTKSNFQKV